MRGHNSGSSIELENKTAFGHLVFLIPLKQQINKGVALLDGKIDPDHKWKIRLPIHCGGRKDYVFNSGYS